MIYSEGLDINHNQISFVFLAKVLVNIFQVVIDRFFYDKFSSFRSLYVPNVMDR